MNAPYLSQCPAIDPTNLGCLGFSDVGSANLNSVAFAFFLSYEKQIPCRNDRKKSKGAAAIKSIDL